MAQCNSNQRVGVPQSIPWWAPLCFANPLSNSQTVGEHEFSICTLFQNYKNIPQFETSFKTFSFENSAASPSLDRNEPPHEKHPTLMVILDCGYESSQGV